MWEDVLIKALLKGDGMYRVSLSVRCPNGDGVVWATLVWAVMLWRLRVLVRPQVSCLR